jgi:ribosomal-protein-alanine N-acetyltransferase
MAFLRSGTGFDQATSIRGDGVWLRPAAASDYPAWAELRQMSRAHLTPWEPQWAADELSRSSFKLRLRHYAREARDDLGYAYLVFRAGDDNLIGGMSLSNVRRGVSQSASLGYWLGLPYVRRGYMRAAVAAVLHHGYDALRLNRVEAACLPWNERSIRVLEACGFTREGLARHYLKINGVWQDHLLYARLRDDGLPAKGDAA